jgi:hypothetical protein
VAFGGIWWHFGGILVAFWWHLVAFFFVTVKLKKKAIYNLQNDKVTR